MAAELAENRLQAQMSGFPTLDVKVVTYPTRRFVGNRAPRHDFLRLDPENSTASSMRALPAKHTHPSTRSMIFTLTRMQYSNVPKALMASYASDGNIKDAPMDSLIAPPTFATARKEAKEDGEGDAHEDCDFPKILKHVDGGGMYRPQGVTTDTPIDKLIPPPVATPRGDGEGADTGTESKSGIRF